MIKIERKDIVVTRENGFVMYNKKLLKIQYDEVTILSIDCQGYKLKQQIIEAFTMQEKAFDLIKRWKERLGRSRSDEESTVVLAIIGQLEQLTKTKEQT